MSTSTTDSGATAAAGGGGGGGGAAAERGTGGESVGLECLGALVDCTPAGWATSIKDAGTKLEVVCAGANCVGVTGAGW